MKRFLALLAALALLAGLLSGCGETTKPSTAIEFEAQTWQLTYDGASDSNRAAAAERFAQLVSQETNGAVTVSCAPAKDAAGGIAAVRDGSVDLFLGSSLSYTALDDRFGVVSLPFLFSSTEAADDALDGAGGTALKTVLGEIGLHCAGFGEDGFRCPTNSLRPITAPEDLQGLRLRVEEVSLLQQAYRCWGAACITAQWPLVYTSLQTGVYDGQEAVLSAATAASMQDVQTYLTDWTGIYSCLFLNMNSAHYDGLSSALRDVVDRCGQTAMAEQREQNRAEREDLLSQWKRVKIATLTKEQTQAFRTLAQPCYDTFAAYPELLSAFTGEN